MSDPKNPWSADPPAGEDLRRRAAAPTQLINRGGGVDPMAKTRPSGDAPEASAPGFEADLRTEVLQEDEDADVEARLAAVADLPTQYELEALPRDQVLNPALEAPTLDDGTEDYDPSDAGPAFDVPRATDPPAPNPWESSAAAVVTPPKDERTAMIPEAQRAEALNFDLNAPPPPARGGPPPVLLAALVGLVLFGATLGAAALLFGDKPPPAPDPLAEAIAADPPPEPEAAPEPETPPEPEAADPEAAAPETADPQAAEPDATEPTPAEPEAAPAPPTGPNPAWKDQRVEFFVERDKDPLHKRLRTTFINALKGDDHARFKPKRRAVKGGVRARLSLEELVAEEEEGELVVQARCAAKGDAPWATVEVGASTKVSTSAPAPPGLLDEIKRDAASACARRLAVSFVLNLLQGDPP